jgi:hypothetical protein
MYLLFILYHDIFAATIFPQKSRKSTALGWLLYGLCPLYFFWTNESFSCRYKSACILVFFQLIPSLTWNLFPHTWYKFLTAATVFTAQRREVLCIFRYTRIFAWGLIILYHTILLLWCWQTAQYNKRYLSVLHKKEFLPLEWPNSVELRVKNVGTSWTKFSSTTSLSLMTQQ